MAALPSRSWNADASVVTTTDRHTVIVRVLLSSIGTRESILIVGAASEAMANEGQRLRGLVLDLTGVRFMNSAALGACLELRKRAASLGAPAAIAGRSHDIREMFDLMKIEHLFVDAPDLESARARLNQAA